MPKAHILVSVHLRVNCDRSVSFKTFDRILAFSLFTLIAIALGHIIDFYQIAKWHGGKWKSFGWICMAFRVESAARELNSLPRPGAHGLCFTFSLLARTAKRWLLLHTNFLESHAHLHTLEYAIAFMSSCVNVFVHDSLTVYPGESASGCGTCRTKNTPWKYFVCAHIDSVSLCILNNFAEFTNCNNLSVQLDHWIAISGCYGYLAMARPRV